METTTGVWMRRLVMLGLLCFSLAPISAPAQKGGTGSGLNLDARMAALESQLARLQSENTALKSRVAALEAKTQYLSTGTDSQGKAALFVTGANVYIRDGSGSTESMSGLGNLTIGYNALRNDDFSPNVRTGSHNLIIGDQNNYSSFGGLVAGYGSTISGMYATVSGGLFNTASGGASSVSGGAYRSAGGGSNWVAGGLFQSD